MAGIPPLIGFFSTQLRDQPQNIEIIHYSNRSQNFLSCNNLLSLCLLIAKKYLTVQ